MKINRKIICIQGCGGKRLKAVYCITMITNKYSGRSLIRFLCLNCQISKRIDRTPFDVYPFYKISIVPFNWKLALAANLTLGPVSIDSLIG